MNAADLAVANDEPNITTRRVHGWATSFVDFTFNEGWRRSARWNLLYETIGHRTIFQPRPKPNLARMFVFRPNLPERSVLLRVRISALVLRRDFRDDKEDLITITPKLKAWRKIRIHDRNRRRALQV